MGHRESMGLTLHAWERNVKVPDNFWFRFDKDFDRDPPRDVVSGASSSSDPCYLHCSATYCSESACYYVHLTKWKMKDERWKMIPSDEAEETECFMFNPRIKFSRPKNMIASINLFRKRCESTIFSIIAGKRSTPLNSVIHRALL